jgi:GNAT superfamily N-acetyltransferase
MRTFSEGFRELSPPSAGDPRERQREMVAEFSDAKHWQLLLAAIAGEQAGIGTLFVDGATAFFGNGATLPRFRGRGVHGALIRARLRAAADAGAAIVYVDTNVSSAAERNLHRYGFGLVGHLEMWSRLPDLGDRVGAD